MSSDKSDLAIKASGLGKTYKIFSNPQDRLKSMLFGRWRKFHTDFWALRNIDIEVPRGTTLGIVGRNGSGKSTLLQLICGTLQRSEGHLGVNGRIAALLELGAGFNPQFTGRENVYMNAAVLGLDRATVKERFQSIADFAEIGGFIDAPVKTYSSGMFARLAFAVAINVDPDILVVDEALSVGDEAFQRRCYNRLDQIRQKGATILFVSHSPGTVIDLCDQALLLDQGELLMSGDPKKVVAEYQKLIYAPPDRFAALRAALSRGEYSAGDKADDVPAGERPDAEPADLPVGQDYYEPGMVSRSAVAHSPNGARVLHTRIVDEDGRQVNVLLPNRVYRFQIQTHFERSTYNARFGIHIKTVSGIGLGGMMSHPQGRGEPFIDADTTVWASFEFRPILTANNYFLDVSVHGWGSSGGEDLLHMVADVDVFRIDKSAHEVASGYVRFGTENYFSCSEDQDAQPPKACDENSEITA